MLTTMQPAVVRSMSLSCMLNCSSICFLQDHMQSAYNQDGNADDPVSGIATALYCIELGWGLHGRERGGVGGGGETNQGQA